ncbi:cell division protease FtsH [Bradyrhizobium ottawaense]|uniref:AAA family ATPase n=1 Tax=Bradyrhizobium ottawaense TaxID=931866 RepID=UPI001BAA26E8|nr:AAA family ATPase [Bradyrhizobium diazoefficiens]MBR0925197.1 AAA family ATPase [Bradyrhizobium diazoefficiens]
MSKATKTGKTTTGRKSSFAALPRIDIDLSAPEEGGAEEMRVPASRPDPGRCLAEAAVRAAVDDDLMSRLNGGETLVVAVQVPTAAWVKQIEGCFKRLAGRALVIGRDGSDRTRHKADYGNEGVADALAEGKPVIGIATSSALLPGSLVAGSDVSIDIAVDGSVVNDAIGRFVGAPARPPTLDGLGALDFGDIVVNFRADSSAADIVDRLKRAANRRNAPRQDRLPKLVDAVEFGEARDFGLSLGEDVRAYRANNLKWSDVAGHANCVFAGDPGLGKTFYARILAEHLGVPLVVGSMSEIFATTAGYLDSVVKGVRDLFQRAEAAKAALFLDELDALPSRVNLEARHLSWWTPVIAEFLLLLDSATNGNREMRFVWAATNHVDRLDPALIRPGRLDRVIHFRPPGPEGIASILRHHLDGDLAGTDLSVMGRLGLGRTPAELAAVVKTARRAARAEKRALTGDDLVEALAPKANVDAATLRRIAVHEAGHAVVGLALGIDELVVVEAIGSAGAWGRTLMRRREGIETRAVVEGRATVNLGGRAAEVVVYGGDCSGNAGGDVSSDLAIATRAVCGLRASMGLGDGLAYLADPANATALLRMDPVLRKAVEADLSRLHASAVDIVVRHRAALDAIAEALAARRHLSGEEARAIFDTNSPGARRGAS